MATATAIWRYRGDPEPERPAALVRFANGRLERPDSLRFAAYRHREAAHPRKRNRRILVAETERLSYVGHNFGSDGMKCNSLCRYFVGVLDRSSGQMEVYNAEIFNMQPLLSDNMIPDDTKEYQKKSYREKMDLCIEAFGTSKQKRALSSRRMNAVGSDIVSTAVTKAAANVIDAKGVTALMQDVAQDDVQSISAFLPPCHEDADRPEHVYRFEDSIFLCHCGSSPHGAICCTGASLPLTGRELAACSAVSRLPPVGSIPRGMPLSCGCATVCRRLSSWTGSIPLSSECGQSCPSPGAGGRRKGAARLVLFLNILPVLSPAEYEALRVPAAALASVSKEEMDKRAEERSLCSFVLEELKFLPTDERSRDHKARCLWFLDTLIKFSQQKVIKKKNPMGPECPHIISKKLMKNFTSLTYNNGSIQNFISASMKAKITAYVIALALHINNFQTDLTILQNDMKLSESRILDIAKALRLRVSKVKGLVGLENNQNHKLGTLSLPLPTQKAPEGQRKRKKMS